MFMDPCVSRCVVCWSLVIVPAISAGCFSDGFVLTCSLAATQVTVAYKAPWGVYEGVVAGYFVPAPSREPQLFILHANSYPIDLRALNWQTNSVKKLEGAPNFLTADRSPMTLNEYTDCMNSLMVACQFETKTSKVTWPLPHQHPRGLSGSGVGAPSNGQAKRPITSNARGKMPLVPPNQLEQATTRSKHPREGFSGGSVVETNDEQSNTRTRATLARAGSASTVKSKTPDEGGDRGKGKKTNNGSDQAPAVAFSGSSEAPQNKESAVSGSVVGPKGPKEGAGGSRQRGAKRKNETATPESDFDSVGSVVAPNEVACRSGKRGAKSKKATADFESVGSVAAPSTRARASEEQSAFMQNAESHVRSSSAARKGEQSSKKGSKQSTSLKTAHHSKAMRARERLLDLNDIPQVWPGPPLKVTSCRLEEQQDRNDPLSQGACVDSQHRGTGHQRALPKALRNPDEEDERPRSDKRDGVLWPVVVPATAPIARPGGGKMKSMQFVRSMQTARQEREKEEAKSGGGKSEGESGSVEGAGDGSDCEYYPSHSEESEGEVFGTQETRVQEHELIELLRARYDFERVVAVIKTDVIVHLRNWKISNADINTIAEEFTTWRPHTACKHTGSTVEYTRREHMRFIAVLMHAGRYLVDVPGDGNCWLHCMMAAFSQNGMLSDAPDGMDGADALRVRFMQYFEKWPLYDRRGQPRSAEEHMRMFVDPGNIGKETVCVVYFRMPGSV